MKQRKANHSVVFTAFQSTYRNTDGRVVRNTPTRHILDDKRSEISEAPADSSINKKEGINGVGLSLMSSMFPQLKHISR